MNKKRNKIVCLGDSFTVGPGVDPGEHWLYHLQADFPSYEFINRGISGDTTCGMLARLDRDVVSCEPAYALIIGGANDLICQGTDGSCKGNSASAIIKNSYMAMIHQLFAAGIKPIIATPTPCIDTMIPPGWSSFYDFSELNRELDDLNRWQKDFAKSFMCSTLDIYTPFVRAIEEDPAKAASLYLDGLHLSAEGQQLVCEILRAELESILR